jgi:rod shape-determining protein MreC
MFKRSYYVAFGLVAVFALLALNLPDRAARRVKLAVSALYLPLFGLAGSLHGLLDQAGGLALPRRALLRELDLLQLENGQLRLRVAQLEEAWLENQRLRESLQWQERSPWRVKAARVVGQDPANWWRNLHIDLGSRDGMRPNLNVLTAEGLVGRVSEVGFARSRVLLVGDPGLRVAAQVQETREKGSIMPSASSLDRLVVELTYLPGTAACRPGHRVITSGDGGIFTNGIPVGTVIAVQTNDFGLYLEAQVRLAANLNRLEEVWVLMP